MKAGQRQAREYKMGSAMRIGARLTRSPRSVERRGAVTCSGGAVRSIECRRLARSSAMQGQTSCETGQVSLRPGSLTAFNLQCLCRERRKGNS